MTKELENFNNILSIIAKNYNVTNEEILSKSHKDKFCIPRHIFRTVLRDCNMTQERIASITKCERTTVLASIAKVRNEYQYHKPEHYAFYKTVKKLTADIKFVKSKKSINAKRVYVCGKITGLNEIEVERKFRLATDYLLTKHENVLNPYVFCKSLGISGWYECMRVLIPLLPSMEIIYVLEDYWDSAGGIWEIVISDKVFNIPIVKLKM